MFYRFKLTLFTTGYVLDLAAFGATAEEARKQLTERFKNFDSSRYSLELIGEN